MPDKQETPVESPKFDFAAFPENTVFHERREGRDRRDIKPERPPGPPPERRAKKERRKRIDPTTFEKQYTPDELEFMAAMQRYKVSTGKPFPTYLEVLQVAYSLGYRRLISSDEELDETVESPPGPGTPDTTNSLIPV